MTIHESKEGFEDLKITIVGDLDHSRVVNSFIEAINCGYCLTFVAILIFVKILLIPIGNFEPELETALQDAYVVMLDQMRDCLKN